MQEVGGERVEANRKVILRQLIPKDDAFDITLVTRKMHQLYYKN